MQDKPDAWLENQVSTALGEFVSSLAKVVPRVAVETATDEKGQYSAGIPLHLSITSSRPGQQCSQHSRASHSVLACYSRRTVGRMLRERECWCRERHEPRDGRDHGGKKEALSGGGKGGGTDQARRAAAR